MFLEKFCLPIKKEECLAERKLYSNGGYLDNAYPCGIFSKNELSQVDFEKITIFYGGNGSGKSTLLNLIAQKLMLKRMSPFNSSELFSDYVDACKYELGFDDYGNALMIPKDSRIITSDDVFDYMLAVRSNNEDIAEEKDNVKSEWVKLKFGNTVKLEGDNDYELYRAQVISRKRSVTRRKFIKEFAGSEVKLNSNGETAINFFEHRLKNDTLFCLDEPENSLSPKMQLELIKIIHEKARYCGCQFIIATHSPFVLSLPNAKIYDLDSSPVELKKWWELENSKIYFDFFNKYRKNFEKPNDIFG